MTLLCGNKLDANANGESDLNSSQETSNEYTVKPLYNVPPYNITLFITLDRGMSLQSVDHDCLNHLFI